MIVVGSVLLGALFLIAGVSKLASPRQWHAQSADLGVPVPVSTVVPYVELMVGALLVSQVARRLVAAGAGVLLIAFTILLIVRLRQGRRPPCACFGALTSTPIGWSNVARNGAFVVLALAIALSS
ncbi:MAG: MauE/DoxX family redox-associated membrane protein [Ilumatobacteraceae bacterium]